ncbi:MAG: DUF3300 domain-containing protein [Pseudolabrys sp.]
MSGWVRRFCFTPALMVPIVLAAAPLPVSAQDQQGQLQQQPPPPPQQQPQQQALTQQQLQQLVAPIALYPDALLAQVLTASTYPLEVTMAARWSEKNQNLKGAALEDAMQKQPWDPSVKGLTSVPQVLAMMNEKLDWTNQLGEAFLAQPDDVQNAIQALRTQAETTGSLKSSKEQKVRRVAATPTTGYVGPPEYIVIEPMEPDYIYVPVYDPLVVYGSGYWAPAYAPFFWYPPWWTVGAAFGFGAALFVGPALYYHYNWGHGGFAAIQTNTVLYSKYNKVNLSGGSQFQNWKFDPAHHGNVQFKNTKLQQQFGNVGGKGVQGIQGIQTGKAVQGIQTGKGLQGVQTGKGVQGIQTSKSIQGVQTSKSIQGVQTRKSIQGIQTGKGTGQVGDKDKSTGRVATSKSLQGIQTGKGNQSVQARRVQGGNKGKDKGVH